MKTTKVISPKVVVPKDNKKISKLPEDVQKLLADWEEFEKNLEKKRKQEMKDLRRNRGKSLPTTKGAQQNGSVHPPVQNEKKKDKEINQEETEKSEDGKVRPWKLRLNETKNIYRLLLIHISAAVVFFWARSSVLTKWKALVVVWKCPVGLKRHLVHYLKY